MREQRFCFNQSMSSEALMDKPMSNAKCRPRSQSWYIVLICFLSWFALFYLYSSSIITFGKKGDRLLGINRSKFAESSESFHHVVKDVDNGDDVEDQESNAESVKEPKPIGSFVDNGAGNVDLVLTNSSESSHEEARDGKLVDSSDDVKDVNDGDNVQEGNGTESEKEPKPIDVNEADSVDQVLKDLEADNVTIAEENGSTQYWETVHYDKENQRVDSIPIVKNKRERARRPRRRSRTKPADSSNVAVELPKRQNVVRTASGSASSCAGRYIYIHNIPKKFNEDLLENCRSLSFWTDMCECSSNLGLGALLPSNEKLYSRTGWFATNQFLLEVIFHNRMKQYKCLTKDPSKASAIYVPYYAGLDVGRYLWDTDGFMRDYDAVNIVKWLASRPEWKKMWGRDHFSVAGRINWDFRRDPKNESDWGNELLNFPESRNMTMLVIESSPWNNNDFAIPYPTYFHPSSDDDVIQWQYRMRRLKRRYLYSFAGARRPNLHESIRNEIIDQCLASRRKCHFLECDKSQKCHKPVYLMKLFQSSIFCLQPPGDSYTRRSIFDSILAGCIPVFFHPGSAYVQYIWHFPKDYNKYSVLIPASDVKSGTANIERILQRIPREKRIAMREAVIRLIPKVIYADPSSRLETIEDAFDLTVKGVLDRVENVRKQMKDGKEVNSDFDEEESWKYFTFGKLGVHEWDPFFSTKLGKLGT